LEELLATRGRPADAGKSGAVPDHYRANPWHRVSFGALTPDVKRLTHYHVSICPWDRLMVHVPSDEPRAGCYRTLPRRDAFAARVTTPRRIYPGSGVVPLYQSAGNSPYNPLFKIADLRTAGRKSCRQYIA
jgi:hypothetical protein